MKVLSVIFSVVMIFTLFAGIVSVDVSASGALIGDIDKDGTITVSDALHILRACAGLKNYDESELPIYDVWSDGAIGVEDALGVLRSSIGIIGSFGKLGVEFTFTPNADAVSLGLNQGMVDRGVLSYEGSSRVAKVMSKAAAGESITIATLGGSITQGTGAENTFNRYANRVYSWWKKNFPQSDVKFQNAGIGATGSLYGVHRVDEHVLAYNPDFLIIEYAVNDRDAGTAETYENLVRKVLKNSPDTAVLLLFMTDMYYNDKQDEEAEIGELYDLPMISYRNAIKDEIESRRITWPEISPDYDGLHPNDRGHGLVAGLVNSYLDGVKRVYEDCSQIVPGIPEAKYGERYIEASMYWCNEDFDVDSMGSFIVDDYYHHGKTGSWYVKNGISPLTFEIRGRNIMLLHEMNVDQNKSGIIKVAIDRKSPVSVDSYFRNGWGNYLVVTPVMTNGTNKVHTVKITPTSGTFRIAAILVS